MTSADVSQIVNLALGVLGGVAATYAWVHRQGRDDGAAAAREQDRDRQLAELSRRIAELEDGHMEILRHVNERATREDLRQMERNVIAQMDSRFANLVALLQR